ncbi:MAG: DMT family transporter [Candidatus Woesearchaeota archaeon]
MEAWIVLAILSAILAAAIALLVKRTLLQEHAMEFSAVLALFNVFATIPLWPKVDWASITPELLLVVFVTSILAAAGFLLIAKGVRHMPVSTASPMLTIQPLVLVVFAFLFIHERLMGLQIVGIAVIVIGAFVMELRKGDHFLNPFKRLVHGKHHIFIIAALIIYSVSGVFDKIILSTYHATPYTYMVLIHFFIAIDFLILMLIFHDGVKGISHGVKQAGAFLFLLAILTVGMRTVQAMAIQQADVSLVVAIKRTSAIFATIIGGSIFREEHVLRKSIGVIIMVAGALLLIL